MTAGPPGPPDGRPASRPAWLEEVVGTVGICPLHLLTGNVHDLHLLPAAPAAPAAPGAPGAPARPRATVDALADALLGMGYRCVVVHRPVTGLEVLPAAGEAAEGALEAARALTGVAELGPRPREVSAERLGAVVRQVVEGVDGRGAPAGARGALVLARASRLVVDPGRLSEAEHRFFVEVEAALARARPGLLPGGGRAVLNPVVWLLDRPGDVPSWLAVDNDAVRTVTLPLPDHGARETMAALLAPGFPDHAGAGPEALARLCAGFADATDGLTLREMGDAARLAGARGTALADVADAVLAYRVGVAENPWRRDHLRRRIAAAEDPASPRALGRRVLGQPQAVTKALDILKRSALGLSGAQAPSSGRRPRGVLFLAGPTGVGKTELAKALAALVFGDAGAYVRFDMSEFGEAHTAARLVGAPPGYVGFDQGGELTNRMRERPFSLVLFDEVEKAHPRILDKFLQVLDEGRLTDSRGATVDFRETLLVFTSNRGMDAFTGQLLHVEPDGSGLPGYDELEAGLLAALRRFFVEEINRPEIYNRFGENFVVLDFIRPPVARAIFAQQLGNVRARVAAEHGLRLAVPDAVHAAIEAACTRDLSLGGRGIGNRVESLVVNPLARALFAAGPALPRGSTATVASWEVVDGVAALGLAPS